MAQTVVLGVNRGLTRGFAKVISWPFVALRVPPNAITVSACLLSLVPAWLASQADWLWGGVSLFLLSGLDLIDGTVARALNRQTKFGGYLDSVLDRASDMIVLFGVGLGINTKAGWLLIGACVLTSFLTSYARARSYQDARPADITWNQVFERPERVIFLSLALVATHFTQGLRPETDPLPWLLLIYALLGVWTVLSRVNKVHRLLRPNP